MDINGLITLPQELRNFITQVLTKVSIGIHGSCDFNVLFTKPAQSLNEDWVIDAVHHHLEAIVHVVRHRLRQEMPQNPPKGEIRRVAAKVGVWVCHLWRSS
jgi:hypothetical protein